MDIGAILRDEHHEEIDLPQHYDCFCHKLNLVGKACTVEAQNDRGFQIYFGKLKKIVKAQNYSAQKAEIIREECGGNLFKLPILTRWNSEYYCIQDCLSKLEKSPNGLSTLMTKLKIPTFKPEEFVIAKEYEAIMKPVVKALNIFQSEGVEGIGLCLPTIIGIKLRLRELEANTFVLTDVLQFVQYEIEHRFNDYFTKDIYILAAISVPQFKTQWLVNQIDKDHAISLLKNAVTEMRVNTTAASVRNQDEPVNASPNLLDFGSENVEMDEVDEYLASKVKTLEAFKRGEFPMVAKVFLRYNTSEAANVRSERLFSRGKLMFGTLRTSLNDSNFEKLVFLNCNKNM